MSDRVVIDTVVAKHSDHLPLYRQSAILERETGLEISRATLDGRVMRVGELLDLLKPQIEAVGAQALPSSALAKAVTYARALWPKLTRFLKHPEMELSNNLAENSMRPVALGRENWIHLGSPQAGPDVSIQRLAELTPAAWAARNQ